ncbi:MAG: hypothetical protein ACRCWD_08435 [Culicoidibacterales bacterium]
MKAKFALIGTLALAVGGWVLYETSKPAVTIMVQNQTDQLLTHVRLEAGPERKKSETIPLAPTESFSWNFRAKEKSYVRLQYQTITQRTNDVIISGYLESHSTGIIKVIVRGENGKYHVSVNQSIRH